MKKLMTFAAAAAMTVVGNAASLLPGACVDCGGGSLAPTDCDTIVFKVTGSGKAVTDKGEYKTVASLKIKKGALALEGTVCTDTGACCYDSGFFFATIKVGKKTFEVGTPVDVKVWSLFGKKLAASQNYLNSIKPGKSVCLESALFVMAPEDSEAWDGEVDFEDGDPFAFWASSFGKVDMKVTKDGKDGYCNKQKGCDPVYTPKKYAGWFVGWYPCVGPEDCFRCECDAVDIFGGTWKAVYQKKITTVSGAQGLAGTSFEIAD